MADDIIEDDFSYSGVPVATAASAARPSSNISGAKPVASLDRGTAKPGGVVQPKPQALPKRTGPASIIVSPRQKGNPVLNSIKSMPWEYGDILADYVLGVTTCALFLSLKYHRLHPEYIYTRIKNLQGKYNLRIILTLVDIQNHEESLRELSKTSLINNVTLILCWSAAEGGRYLELFKTYENAAPTAIKQHQSTAYSDRLVDFVTTPRSINKTDAVSLVSQFGTIRTAVNATHEDIATIAGWGEKKVQRWCASVREPFRIKRAGKRGLADGDSSLLVSTQPVSRAGTLSRDVTRDDNDSSRPGSSSLDASALRASNTPGLSRLASAAVTSDADRRSNTRLAEERPKAAAPDEDGEAALAEAIDPAPITSKKAAGSTQEAAKKRKPEEDLSDGVMAALSKLRKS
ncbi:Mating-type switching protein swi10 [Teratosphaeria destructans]|uniref:Mating-type switching protein swi10 n=1 Tax=Teratosphaeria destructans TaxID=418781 RepID=A0A9W7T1Y1_9PEZI|nr:Mating-type switching protein swi10 [Teratosphaeria destructans]